MSGKRPNQPRPRHEPLFRTHVQTVASARSRSCQVATLVGADEHGTPAAHRGKGLALSLGSFPEAECSSFALHSMAESSVMEEHWFV